MNITQELLRLQGARRSGRPPSAVRTKRKPRRSPLETVLPSPPCPHCTAETADEKDKLEGTTLPCSCNTPKVSLRRKYRAWSCTESALLKTLVQQSMAASLHSTTPTQLIWQNIAKLIPGRTAKQCRDRWSNQMHPGIVRSSWVDEEDVVMVWMHSQVGPKWSTIAAELPGRTSISVKNRWHSHARKRPDGSPTILWTYVSNLMNKLPRSAAFAATVATCRIDDLVAVVQAKKKLPRPAGHAAAKGTLPITCQAAATAAAHVTSHMGPVGFPASSPAMHMQPVLWSTMPSAASLPAQARLLVSDVTMSASGNSSAMSSPAMEALHGGVDRPEAIHQAAGQSQHTWPISTAAWQQMASECRPPQGIASPSSSNSTEMSTRLPGIPAWVDAQGNAARVSADGTPAIGQSMQVEGGPKELAAASHSLTMSAGQVPMALLSHINAANTYPKLELSADDHMALMAADRKLQEATYAQALYDLNSSRMAMSGDYPPFIGNLGVARQAWGLAQMDGPLVRSRSDADAAQASMEAARFRQLLDSGHLFGGPRSASFPGSSPGTCHELMQPCFASFPRLFSSLSGLDLLDRGSRARPPLISLEEQKPAGLLGSQPASFPPLLPDSLSCVPGML